MKTQTIRFIFPVVIYLGLFQAALDLKQLTFWRESGLRFHPFTLPKTNIVPENRPSQKGTSIPTIHFQVRAVSFREGKSFK